MPSHPDVPGKIIAKLRSICLAFPEAYEEKAWVGTRWCIRKKNFAHVLMIEDGWPPAYARVAASDGPLCVLTFRSAVAEHEPRVFTRRPFFRPGWWPDIAGMDLDANTDWDDVAKLIAGSYRTLAHKRMTRLLDEAQTKPAARKRRRPV